MAMMNYRPMRLPPTQDPMLKNELLQVDRFLRQLVPFAARTPTFPQGSPASGVDLSQFLYLPGRAPEQWARGRVVFDVDGDYFSQALATINGMSWRAVQTNGFSAEAYFRLADSGANYIARWTLPYTGSNPSDNVFVAESSSQTLTNKTIQQSSIYVGTAASKNTFINSNNTNQQFLIALSTSFPTTSVQTPTLRLPSLDVTVPTTDRHTFMMLHASVNAPFTPGSVPYGNNGGTEMEMLAAGSNGSLLQFNSGETVVGATWSTGTFTITGVFDVTKTRIGMRVVGNSGLSIYVDENTRITNVTATTLTVDTALVGNSVGTTITTFGPTWTLTIPIATIEHSQTTDRTGFTVSCTTNGTTALTSAALFGPVQAGHMIFGTGIPAGTTVQSVTDASNLVMSQAATDSTTNTRTFASDDHSQYLALYGRTGGQFLGASPQPAGATFDDIGMSGRLNIGTSTWTSTINDFSLQVAKSITTTQGQNGFVRFVPTIGVTGGTSNTYRAMLAQITGGGSIASGSPTFVGGRFLASMTGSSSYTIGSIIGQDMLASMAGTGATAATIIGMNAQAQGNTATYPGDSADITSAFTGLRMTLVPGKSSPVVISGLEFQVTVATTGGVTPQAIGVNLENFFGSGAFTSFSTTGTVTAGNNVVNNITSPNFRVGMIVVATAGPGAFPTGTYITNINAGALQVTVSANATAGGAGATTMSFNGAITKWSGIYVASDRPGNVLTHRVLDLQSNDESQIFGRIYFRPPTPTNYPAPTAFVHIGAGAAAASSAPLKFDLGTLQTVAEAGAAEYDGTLFYLSHSDAVRTSVVTQRGVVNRTAQVAAIGATTLYAAPAAGYYTFNYTLETTTADAAAGTIQIQVNYTDDIGATNQTGAALVLTATGRDRGSFQVWANAAQNIQYQTNLTGIIGTSQYALRVRLVHLG